MTSLGLSVLIRRWGVQLAGQVDWCAAVGKLSKLKYLELWLQVRYLWIWLGIWVVE